MDRRRRLKTVAVLSLTTVALCAGCGFIADKDRIKIARINERFIDRGELFRIIREMPDDERPIIQNKGDMLRVLRAYLDEQIKMPLSDEVEAELDGKPLVPREMATQRFFQEHPDDDYQALYAIEDAEAVGMSEAQLEVAKEQIELSIDRTLDRLRGDAAVQYRAVAALKTGLLTLDDADFQQEYNLRKGELKKLEWMQFRGFRFPTDMPKAEQEAANVRKRLDAGEDFEKLSEEYTARNSDFVVHSEIENNPTLAKFRGFWVNASGCEKGDIIGPVYLPEYHALGEPDQQGRQMVKAMPAAYMVIEVLDHRPETTLTLQEAKRALAPPILMAKMMELLREQNGVQIFEDKLPDPALFSKRSRTSEWDNM